MQKALGWTIAIVILIVLGVISLFSHFFTDMWWFQSVGYYHVFWVRIAWVWGVRIGAALLAAAFIYLNLRVTRNAIAQAMTRFQDRLPENLTWSSIRWGFALVSLLLGVLFGLTVASSWQKIAMFWNSQPFGLADPIFQQDISFYIFSLPFFNLVNSILMGLLVLSLFVSGAIYLFTGAFQLDGFRLHLVGTARWHLSLLLAGIVGLKAWGYLLKLYDLLYTSGSVLYGATYTNIVANRPALYIMACVAAAIALGILINAFRPGATRWIMAGLATLVVASVLLGGVYPNIVQKVRVEPNQLKLEQPYIANHIAMTRAAYALDKIVETDVTPSNELTAAQINAEQATIQNIRLWDWNSLLKAYRQLQEFKNYYKFADMDVDRYTINGVYSQVMLSAREMDTRNLPTLNWINQYLVYTHGFGVVASPVNRVTSEGMPTFLLSNIPPAGVPELNVTQPEIYYGELADQFTQYVIVNTDQKEFDYPKGDTDVYSTYAGHGGVLVSNPIRSLAFAARFQTPAFLLNGDINSNSRVMMYRNVHDLVKKIAPFLTYDQDPYVVVANGKVYWMLDAYTTSDRFPYSRPVRFSNTTLNYIRNSVKVVIDAYNGDVNFYLMEDEPLAKALLSMYGVHYQPVANMPSELRTHIRYPEDLFNVQSNLYANYHMTDTQVYYNKSDAWEVPQNVQSTSLMEPYYVIMRLPGQANEELVMLRPYTPLNKDNMAAWLAARSDGKNYGQVIVYNFPKQNLTYGPSQIEARIDQDGEISSLFTLWSQAGSEVIRGNLLVIPVANTLLYVEPIFLQAEKSQMPELKRVIVVQGSKVAIGATLGDALEQLVGQRVASTVAPNQAGTASPTTATGATSEQIRRVNESYNKVEQRFKAGDWAGYGQAMVDLKKAIGNLGK